MTIFRLYFNVLHYHYFIIRVYTTLCYPVVYVFGSLHTWMSFEVHVMFY